MAGTTSESRHRPYHIDKEVKTSTSNQTQSQFTANSYNTSNQFNENSNPRKVRNSSIVQKALMQ